MTEAPVCRLASVGAGGVPHVIPVCPVFEGETLYVDLDPGGVTARAFRANPRLTALFDEYDDDWDRLRAVILRCTGAIASHDEAERAWALLRQKFPQHAAIGWEPRLTLALRVDSWVDWGFD